MTDNEFVYNQKVMLQNDDNVVVYNRFLYDSFHMFNKERYQILAWIFFSMILIGADVLLYVSLFFMRT